MKDKRIEERIQHSLNAELSGLRTTSDQRDQFFENATGGYKVKRKISAVAILVAALMLITVTALAATGAFQKLWEIWQSSFRKMNTTGAVEIVEDFDHEAFEEEYGGVKEDLIISTVPEDGDLDYDRAYAISRQAIIDRFGTPEDELDAMGVYPNFYESPYHDESGEWELYFSSRRDVNIDDDHNYDAPGEYRVWIESPSGKVTNCIWYLDAFFPDYARRTWEAGKTDYVFTKAESNQFYEQPQEDQAYFIGLFENAGYDISVISKTDEQKLAGIELDIFFAEADKNLMHADSPEIQAAIGAMEQVSGMTLAQMDSACFILLRSPLASDTLDYCFGFNYNIEETLYDQLGEYQWQAHTYVSRLGSDMICLDPESLSLVKHVHADRSPAAERADDPNTLLGRRNWTKDDLPEFEELLQRAADIDARVSKGELTANEARIQFFELMILYGGDPDIYQLPKLDETTAKLVADQYLSIHYPEFSTSGFDQVTCRLMHQDSYFKAPYYVFDYFVGDNPAYEVIIHTDSGEILYSAGPEDGNG